MLRFPTTIPIRPTEFDEFKHTILSQYADQQKNKTKSSKPEHHHPQLEMDQIKSKADRIGVSK
ncbi:hypothetical protein CROQUDRAFT_654518 [Cronartium quercuum f. sp. fusiforme G11]|uniref:Uncharacterized protein n=1 Tax=Cronartium quercuum f. sp. fusiforme G11 TaxID=708437 RepID=A0A9P6TDT5_9BASI|nr:hypothetical protein CROQUDRAFT_654518 [Cronartium quercuum f. sp. fusiforme G11]